MNVKNFIKEELKKALKEADAQELPNYGDRIELNPPTGLAIAIVEADMSNSVLTLDWAGGSSVRLPIEGPAARLRTKDILEAAGYAPTDSSVDEDCTVGATPQRTIQIKVQKSGDVNEENDDLPETPSDDVMRAIAILSKLDPKDLSMLNLSNEDYEELMAIRQRADVEQMGVPTYQSDVAEPERGGKGGRYGPTSFGAGMREIASSAPEFETHDPELAIQIGELENALEQGSPISRNILMQLINMLKAKELSTPPGSAERRAGEKAMGYGKDPVTGGRVGVEPYVRTK